jgi:hypothetical protein
LKLVLSSLVNFAVNEKREEAKVDLHEQILCDLKGVMSPLSGVQGVKCRAHLISGRKYKKLSPRRKCMIPNLSKFVQKDVH